MRVELDNITLTIDEVLGEVPLDLRVGRLSIQVLVERADALVFHVRLGQERELGGELRGNPLFDLSLIPGFLRAELVAGDGENLESTFTVGTIHLLILTVVLVGETSLGGDVDDDDGFGIGGKG